MNLVDFSMRDTAQIVCSLKQTKKSVQHYFETHMEFHIFLKLQVN